MAFPEEPKAAIVICLGLSPSSQARTMKSLAICSGILDYFRNIQGRGFIMAVNFSASRLLQANSPRTAEQCIREDCQDWCDVLDTASKCLKRSGAECSHLEVVLVGADEVPCKNGDPLALCRSYRGNGIRINSVVVEPDVNPTQQDWNLARLSRETGGLALSPNDEGKLAIHQLFGEMFRRWGEEYWSQTK